MSVTFSYFRNNHTRGAYSYGQAVEVAKKANVGQSFITHYDPDHNNTFLKEMEKQCQQLFLNSRLGRVGEEVLV